ncbi:hypothetical protein SNE40_012742 [Patella caerulea]|uniref:DUF19 domain-containing protein n=1 Tax=Patella caerulea TaxID=87958 RepID=A0AAN8JQ32_PATCE
MEMKTCILLTAVVSCIILKTESTILDTMVKRYYHCDEAEIFRCLSPVADFENPFDSQLAKFDSEEDLHKMCGVVNEVKSCIGEKLRQCYNTRAKLSVDTIENILGYLCGNGKAVFLSEAKCWESEEFLEGMKVCEAVTSNVISNAKDINVKCDALFDLSECLAKMTTDVCNYKAGKFMYEMISAGLVPSKRFLRCGLGFRLGSK